MDNKPRVFLDRRTSEWFATDRCGGRSFPSCAEAVEWAMAVFYGRGWIVPGSFIAEAMARRSQHG